MLIVRDKFKECLHAFPDSTVEAFVLEYQVRHNDMYSDKSDLDKVT